jgi:hypothetical protein
MKGFSTEGVKIDGTHLQGEIVATRRELEKVFGKPTYETDDTFDKVTTEWHIRFADGVVATIYDWKRYEMGAPSMDEKYDWHIGGHDSLAVEHVEDHLLVYA